MTPENWKKVKNIFNVAVEMPTFERADFLREMAGDEGEIRREIEKLIAADKEAETFAGGIIPLPKNDFFRVEQIGNYKIIREIGEGGMGTVYLASRADFDRQVALKIIKYEFSSTDQLRRFRNERKILASLEHPNIALLFDGGTTEKGLPYFVMEYIEGEDLLTYCNSQNLSIEERLKIFRKICSAVSYAHGKLIVHRDLKPSNILVTKDGEPKLLDFGISKLLDEDSFEHTGTATAMGMMTPNYASPEQFRGETVSTSTDVYSLGVILYELLTGVLPYQIHNKRIDEVARAVCETEPERPSILVSGHSTINSKTSNTQLNKSGTRSKGSTTKALRGDLDNIVLKSLRKETERRYSSVEKFSDDIRRHLEGLPVTARPDTFSYRAEKFIKRNRAAVLAGALIFLTLLGGIAATGWQAIRAERQRVLAEKRFNQVRELANNVVFKYHDAIANLPGSTEVRHMLIKDATSYLDQLSQDAKTDEQLQHELAQAYNKLADVQGKVYYSNVGDTAGAVDSYRKAIAIFEELENSKDEELKSSVENELITAYHYYSSINSRILNFDEALSAQQKCLTLAQRKFSASPDVLKTRVHFIRANGGLGDVYAEAGYFNEALNIYRKTLVQAEEANKIAPDDISTTAILGVYHDRVGRHLILRGHELEKTDFSREELAKLYQEGRQHLEKTVELFAIVAAQKKDDANYRRNLADAESSLGMVLRDVGEFDLSLKYLQKVVSDRENEIAKDPINTQLKADYAESLHYHALVTADKKETAKSIRELEISLQTMDKLIEEDNLNMEFWRTRFEIANDYGDLLLKNSEPEAALKIYQTAFEKVKTKSENDIGFLSFTEGMTNFNIGNCYAQMTDKGQEKKANVEKMNTAYQKAFELWQQPDVQQRYLNRTPELFTFLQKKLN